jgi:hypothetical protein
MTRGPRAAALALAAALSASPVAGWAACSTAGTGARCIAVIPAPVALAPAPAPPVEVGQRLDRGRYSILLNAEYYGLPPVSDGWVYMRVGRDVFRVDWRSHQVIERVTDRVAANF